MTVLLFVSKIKNGIFQEKVGNLMDLPLGNLPGPRQLTIQENAGRCQEGNTLVAGINTCNIKR